MKEVDDFIIEQYKRDPKSLPPKELGLLYNSALVLLRFRPYCVAITYKCSADGITTARAKQLLDESITDKLFVPTSKEVGSKKPNELMKTKKVSARDGSFTKWHGGKYFASTALTTGVDKNKFIAHHNESAWN